MAYLPAYLPTVICRYTGSVECNSCGTCGTVEKDYLEFLACGTLIIHAFAAMPILATTEHCVTWLEQVISNSGIRIGRLKWLNAS